MSILKSKKLWLVVVGSIIAMLVAYVMLALGLSEELVSKAIMIILGLMGLTVTGHIVSDAISMAKGLQVKKDG